MSQDSQPLIKHNYDRLWWIGPINAPQKAAFYTIETVLNQEIYNTSPW